MPVVRVQTEDFDTASIVRDISNNRTDIGAIVTFTGLVRDTEHNLHAMTLEHYPAMTEKALNQIVDDAMDRWQLLDVVVIHRVGELSPSDQIVLVVTASAHRADAFQANEYIMDYLKTRAPFWKKESTDSGEQWVDARDSDDQAASRWGK